MPSTFRRLAGSTVVTIAHASILPFSALAETGTTHAHGSENHGSMKHHLDFHSGTPNDRSSSGVPTLPGQDAFAAIAEIAEILSADPDTDWSKVNMRALREHLVDMNRVTLDADAQEEIIEDGLDVVVSGQGRTIDAIQNMVIAHAPQLDQLENWTASAEKLPSGARLTVTSTDTDEIARIRGLGFFGLMASGAHHKPHHMGMAKGLMVHSQ